MKSKEEVKVAQAKVDALGKSKPPKVRGISPSALAEIVAMAQMQLRYEGMVAEMESSLADQKEMLRRIQEDDLPSAMAEAGLQKFTLDTGETIEIKHDFAVGIPKERMEEAFDYLECNGYGAMVSTDLVISFWKGELPKAQELLLELQKRKLNCAIKRGIHWQTLKAWVKDMDAARDEKGKPKQIPLDVFGAHPLDKSIVKKPKTK